MAFPQLSALSHPYFFRGKELEEHDDAYLVRLEVPGVKAGRRGRPPAVVGHVGGPAYYGASQALLQ